MTGKYVIVTNPRREKLNANYLCGTAGKISYPYRNMELGRIHPEIIMFYSDPERLKKQQKTFLGTTSFFPLGHYLPESGDYQVLMHDAHASDTEGYFIVPLWKNEFSLVEGNDLNSVRKGLMDIAGMLDSLIVESSFSKLEKRWRYLEAFDILIPESRIGEIPVESSERHVSEERVKLAKESTKKYRNPGFIPTPGLKPFRA